MSNIRYGWPTGIIVPMRALMLSLAVMLLAVAPAHAADDALWALLKQGGHCRCLETARLAFGRVEPFPRS